MKIYFAGNTGHGKAGITREKYLKQTNCSRLFSLFWVEDFIKNFRVWSNRIVHCKKEPFDVYIGRPSIWGNPFKIDIDGSREEVIKKYEEWILKQPQLIKQLPTLKGKILGCWCPPKPCHGEVLFKLIENIPKKNVDSKNRVCNINNKKDKLGEDTK